METVTKTITPDYARELLATNTKNRLLRTHAVRSMTRDIINGDWKLTGESIKIDKNGVLIDGQHRLNAVIKANMAIRCVVCYNVDEEAMSVIDSGIKRTMSDRFKINGVIYPSQTAAVINFMHTLARGSKGLVALTSSEYELLLERHPDITDSVITVSKSKIKGTRTLLGACHYIATYLGHSEAANMFVETFISGVGTYRDDPARFLREYIIADFMKANQMTTNFKRRLFVHALNKYLIKDTMTRAIAPEVFAIKGWDLKTLGLVR